jgi:pimeloyl-ACP methyl ester carboxylesterase
VYRGELPFSDLVAANTVAQTQDWSRYVFSGVLPAKITLDPPGAYDPEPVLSRLRVPMLAIYGAKDNRVLGEDNARLMATLLRRAGNRDFIVRVFPNANHDMIEIGDWPVTDDLKSRKYIDGYFQYLIDWIIARAVT